MHDGEGYAPGGLCTRDYSTPLFINIIVIICRHIVILNSAQRQYFAAATDWFL